MLIRDFERPVAPQRRNKNVSPMRRTAEGLGAFLDRLSAAVRESADAVDSVDSGLRAHARGSRSGSRGFKFPAPSGEAAPPVDLNLTGEQGAALGMLVEARNLASDASNKVMAAPEREVSQERLKAIFLDLSARRIDILSSIFSKSPDAEDDSFFSLLTPEKARAAYSGIDDMIMRFLDAGTKGAAAGPDSGGSPYLDHNTALSASEQLRDFLLAEGPAKAFARFREVNRSHVLGLLQQ